MLLSGEKCKCLANGNWRCRIKPVKKRDCMQGEVLEADACTSCTCKPNGRWKCRENSNCEAECAVGETKEEGCARCSCSATTNMWECELRECGLPPRCNIGDKVRQDNNVYRCANNSTWELKEKTRPDRPKCAQGETKQRGCRTCVCNDNVKCDCPPKSACGQRRVCAKEGATKMISCNQCVCHDGRWDCQDTECPDADSDMDCDPEYDDPKSAGDGCNTVTCSSNGKWESSTLTCNEERLPPPPPPTPCANYACPVGYKADYTPGKYCTHPAERSCKPCECMEI